MNTRTILDWAKGYASVGWRVFPLPPCSKKATLTGWPEKASADPAAVAQMFGGHSGNIALVCGEGSGVLVIDIDMPDGQKSIKELESQLGNLPPTRTARTGSGGMHLFYKYPAGRVIPNGKAATNIDIKSNRGYVVLPPSVHPDGPLYAWENALPIAELPAAWIEKFITKRSAVPKKNSAKKNSPKAASGGTTNNSTENSDRIFGLEPYVEKAMLDEMKQLAVAPEGERNDTLFKAVAALAGFIPSNLLTEETLRGKAEEAFIKCHPQGYESEEFEATFASAVTNGMQNPRIIPEPLPFGFRIISSGLGAGLWFDEPSKKEGDSSIKIRIGPPLHVRGFIRDDDSNNWGQLLEWNDHDGKPHRLNLPHELLSAADSSGWRAQLAKQGWLGQGGRKGHELLTRYLTNSKPARRLTGVPRTGWHGDNFVLPDKVIPQAQSDSIILQTTPSRNPYSQGGSLEGWQASIGQWANGNTRLLFALCASLSGPLLGLLNQESGGVNWTGASSTGKTTTLFAAATVWGKGVLSDGYILPWRSTDNGLEAQAALHSDTVLCLDELSQASARTLNAVAYMLGNSQGKARASRTGAERPIKTWRVMVLSTGEQGLADKLAEDGSTVKAGQAVRILDIPADAGAGLGLFENLHGHASSQAFADAIRQAAATHYGHAGPLFIEELQKNIDTAKGLAKKLPVLAEKLSGGSADGQVKRAAMRFALCGLAGKMAVDFGILPVNASAVESSVKACFDVWLDARGGTGPQEELQLVDRAIALLEQHGSSRFENLIDPRATCHGRLGFRYTPPNEPTDYYLHGSGFLELCKGVSKKYAVKVLTEAGILIREDKQHVKSKLPRSHPEENRKRFYRLRLPVDASIAAEVAIPASDTPMVLPVSLPSVIPPQGVSTDEADLSIAAQIARCLKELSDCEIDRERVSPPIPDFLETNPEMFH